MASLARSTSVWMSIKSPSRLPMSLKLTMLRSPTSGPLAPVTVDIDQLVRKLQSKANPWSLSMKRDPVGTGSIAI